ncbi:zinc-ribbon domain-containing protein [Lutimaribacter marinistellae]|uniref:Zinc-ribbon domain-containing protein n=1 Tax=Lutimaribacter marinistellae TaxID=1820329 RepID=A0ABV7TBV3_9RHOB
MRLTCPNCGAQYEVPAEVIPPEGRDVQCSNCGDTWFQPHPEMAEPAPAEDDTARQAPPEQPEPAEFEPEPEEDDLPETEVEAPIPPESAAPQRKVDPAISDILREEAEREANLRRSEAETLESQPDLGLDSGNDEPARRAREAQSRMAAMRGEEPPASTSGGEPGSRRELLPDIEEINSTLRNSGEARARDVQPARPEKAPRSRGGFLRGFALVLILAALLYLLYANAPQIAQSVPQADPMLSAYVALVDQGRLWIDSTLGPLLGQ